MQNRVVRLGHVARALVVLATLAIPSIAFAQATLSGTVHDASGAVLPGVTVEAASPALIEKVRSAITDSTGQFRVTELPPGTYSLTFTLPGFTTIKREAIEVSGVAVTTINADMRRARVAGDVGECFLREAEHRLVRPGGKRRLRRQRPGRELHVGPGSKRQHLALALQRLDQAGVADWYGLELLEHDLHLGERIACRRTHLGQRLLRAGAIGFEPLFDGCRRCLDHEQLLFDGIV